MRRLLLLVSLVGVGAAVFFLRKNQLPTFVPPKTITAASMYKASGSFPLSVGVFDDDVKQPTQIEITPDGNIMFVGTLPGTILVYQKIDGQFRRQSQPFFTLKTSQPGFPPEEAGLTGIALGADFEKSGDVFLLYSFAFEKKSFRNRVARVTFSKQGENIVGINPQQIFEAATPGTGSHQIQDGVGVMVAGNPHLIFTIGEGFKAARALDPKEEAGKVMLIARDGSAPAGTRPFPESPKVQALGIRNAPAMARNPVNEKIAIGDTGPNNYDRFIYGTLIEAEGKNGKKISLNWDGTEESLQKGATDLYDANKEMILHRWTPTETAVNIAFYDHEQLPKLPTGSDYVLVNLFGRTGEKTNTPGKKIMLGTLAHGFRNSLTMVPLVERAPEGEGQFGHPLGLAVDPITKDIFFGDIMEGRLYKVQIGGDTNE